jgi:uncharacterized protein (TIGR02996 family)
MPTDADFLRMILADPDADAPRLAFADWREECGDAARAEFVRVQCALAAMPEGEREYHPLRGREAVLSKLHVADWFRPLERLWIAGLMSGWRGRVRKFFTYAGSARPQFRFQRGFVECLAISLNTYLPQAAAISEATPLRDLEVSSEEEDDGPPVGALADCPQLARLTTLGLNFDDLPPDQLRRVFESPHLRGLRELSIRGWLADEVVSHLAASVLIGRLDSLCLSGSEERCVIDLGPIVQAADGLALTSLSLRRVGLGGTHLRSFSLSCFTGLSRLDVSWNPVGDDHAGQVIHGLPPALTDLDLSHTLFGDRAAAALAASPHLRRLRALNLAGNWITDAGALALADSQYLVASTRLDLRNNPISRRVQNALRVRCGHHVLV